MFNSIHAASTILFFTVISMLDSTLKRRPYFIRVSYITPSSVTLCNTTTCNNYNEARKASAHHASPEPVIIRDRNRPREEIYNQEYYRRKAQETVEGKRSNGIPEIVREIVRCRHVDVCRNR